MVGPITLRRKILRIDDKNSQKKLLFDTNGTFGTKFNTSFNETNLSIYQCYIETKLKLEPIDKSTNVMN